MNYNEQNSCFLIFSFFFLYFHMDEEIIMTICKYIFSLLYIEILDRMFTYKLCLQTFHYKAFLYISTFVCYNEYNAMQFFK